MPEEQFSKEAISDQGAEFKIKQSEIQELKERMERIETQLEKETIPEKKEKIVKQEIKSYLQELQQTPPSAPPIATRDEAEEIKKFPSNQQVGALISLVFEKGLREAVSVARNLNNPAILDEFHDILVDRHYQELIKKKILKSL